MAQDRVNSDMLFLGNVHIQKLLTFTVPFLDDTGVKVNANISASKLIHRHAIQYNQLDGTNVIAQSEVVHYTRAAGNLASVEVFPTTGPSGGTVKYTVDVEKSVAGGAFVTVLTSPVDVVNGSTDRVKLDGAIAAAALLDDTAIRVVVAIQAGSGAQGQGLGVILNIDENPI